MLNNNCTTVIEYSRINFHNENIPQTIQIFDSSKTKFGIFDLKLRDNIERNRNIHIFLSIDCSESMEDLCNDGKTKIQHIKHTLENILTTLHKNEEYNISIQCQSFDINVDKIIDNVENIRDANLELLLSNFEEKLIPKNSTNIELALKSASEEISKYKLANPTYEITHIFLTDGEITEGSKNNEELLSFVPKDCYNIFIGYGLEHDTKLLSYLATDRIKNEYRFIDVLENAGLVYGEIIHGILYRAFEDVKIEINRGEIYDFLTNTWEQELNIGSLLIGQQKTFHIRSKYTHKLVVSVIGKNIIQNNYEMLTEICVLNDDIKLDLNTYMFRQRTQEFLYHSHKISNKDIKKSLNEISFMKNEINEFYKIMTNFMKLNNLETNQMMKMLCDDIYIAYKTLGTSTGILFICARHKSNGLEQTYMCTAPKEKNIANNPLSKYYNEIREDNDLRIDNLRIIEIDNYIPSKRVISPYKTTLIENLMRQLSEPKLNTQLPTHFITKTMKVVRLEDLL